MTGAHRRSARGPGRPPSHDAEASRAVIRAIAFVPYPRGTAPGQRYRMEQWAPWLAEHGIAVTFAPFLSPIGMEILYAPGHVTAKIAETLKGYWRLVRKLSTAGTYDVAYIYREGALLGPAWIEAAIARRVPVVYDFDDAIYLPAASSANSWTRRLKSPEKVSRLCGMAQCVVVGNEMLAQYARQHAAAVVIVPSTIDTDQYQVHARPPNRRPIVGWTGSQTTAIHLEGISDALNRLRAVVDHELRIIGARPKLAGDHIHLLPWSAETEVADLRAVDVGLMPLPDDQWSRGKCGMKALQYMALGIPPVVSPVGMNASLVKHGVNGMHARTEDEWVENVAVLLRDADLRARLGAAARSTVEDHYSGRKHAGRVAQVLREAAMTR